MSPRAQADSGVLEPAMSRALEAAMRDASWI